MKLKERIALLKALKNPFKEEKYDELTAIKHELHLKIREKLKESNYDINGIRDIYGENGDYDDMAYDIGCAVTISIMTHGLLSGRDEMNSIIDEVINSLKLNRAELKELREMKKNEAK